LLVVLVIVITGVLAVGSWYIWESTLAKKKTEALRSSIVRAKSETEQNQIAQRNAHKSNALAAVDRELGHLETEVKNNDTNLQNLQAKLGSLADGPAMDSDPGTNEDEEHLTTPGSYQNAFINKSDLDRERTHLNELGQSLVQRREQLRAVAGNLLAKKSAIVNS
jgi:Tfp pilus assembly protein PilO